MENKATNLVDILNKRFDSNAEIITENIKAVDINVGENFNDKFGSSSLESIKKIASGLSRNDKHLQVVSLDSDREGNIKISAEKTDFAAIRYMRANTGSPRPNILSVCGLVHTKDGLYVIDRRSERMATYPGHFHTIGGSVEPRESVEEALRRETSEELGISQDMVNVGEPIGLIREPKTGFLQLLYSVEIDSVIKELASIRKGNEKEGCQLYCGDNRAEYERFLSNNWGNFVPTGLVGFILEGKKRFGEKWANAILSRTRNAKIGQGAVTIEDEFYSERVGRISYINGRFDVAIEKSERIGGDFISSRLLSGLRCEVGLFHPLTIEGSYTRDAGVFSPYNEVYWIAIRDSPLLDRANAVQATKLSFDSREFGVDFDFYKDMVLEDRDKPVERRRAILVPYNQDCINGDGSSDLDRFLLSSKYNGVLREAGYSESPLCVPDRDYIFREGRAFVRQAWLGRVSEGDSSGGKSSGTLRFFGRSLSSAQLRVVVPNAKKL
ncbi:MAG: NUDIX domain-containing protein [Nanoarchaeota archaeon]